MTITVGFTGTRQGTTQDQFNTLKDLIQELDMVEFHHGCCIGADNEAHILVRSYTDAIIIGHPPVNTHKMATLIVDRRLEPMGYLERNRAIVNATSHLIATPNSDRPKPRSGTWYTIMYAKRQGKKVTIIYPDGNIN